jgi:type II secretory pathway component GspD/PulD (secretin)
MRTSLIALAITTLLAGGNAATGDEKARAAKVVSINMRVCDGVPTAASSAVKIKVFSEPRIRVNENQTFIINVGKEIAVPNSANGIPDRKVVGIVIQGTPAYTEDGRIKLDLVVDNSVPSQNSSDDFEFHVDHLQTLVVVKPGKVVRLRCGRSDDGESRWLEILFDKPK